jgi:hypothetical protein
MDFRNLLVVRSESLPSLAFRKRRDDFRFCGGFCACCHIRAPLLGRRYEYLTLRPRGILPDSYHYLQREGIRDEPLGIYPVMLRSADVIGEEADGKRKQVRHGAIAI